MAQRLLSTLRPVSATPADSCSFHQRLHRPRLHDDTAIHSFRSLDRPGARIRDCSSLGRGSFILRSPFLIAPNFERNRLAGRSHHSSNFLAEAPARSSDRNRRLRCDSNVVVKDSAAERSRLETGSRRPRPCRHRWEPRHHSRYS